MICDQCMAKNSFLETYLPYSIPSQACVVKKIDTNEKVDIESVNCVSESKTTNGNAVSVNVKTDIEISEPKKVCQHLLVERYNCTFYLKYRVANPSSTINDKFACARLRIFPPQTVSQYVAGKFRCATRN